MKIAKIIDHTLLRPDCTSKELQLLCKEAVDLGLFAVCIPPFYVKNASNLLKGAPQRIATVIGFPMGYAAIPAKVEEIKRAINDGADEIDAVINICAVKDGNWSYVRNEIDAMTTAVHMRGKTIKLILETGLLKKAEISRLCTISNEIGVNFVKNATGFNAEGASIEVIAFLRKNLDPSIKLKAAGGIRTADFAKELIAAGANRIGSSTPGQLLKPEI